MRHRPRRLRLARGRRRRPDLPPCRRRRRPAAGAAASGWYACTVTTSRGRSSSRTGRCGPGRAALARSPMRSSSGCARASTCSARAGWRSGSAGRSRSPGRTPRDVTRPGRRRPGPGRPAADGTPHRSPSLVRIGERGADEALGRLAGRPRISRTTSRSSYSHSATQSVVERVEARLRARQQDRRVRRDDELRPGGRSGGRARSASGRGDSAASGSSSRYSPLSRNRFATRARNDSPCDCSCSGVSPYSERSGANRSSLSTKRATLKKLSALEEVAVARPRPRQHGRPDPPPITGRGTGGQLAGALELPALVGEAHRLGDRLDQRRLAGAVVARQEGDRGVEAQGLGRRDGRDVEREAGFPST